MKVVILGASPKPERYAHKALVALKKHGHLPLPVNPKYPDIDGVKCFGGMNEVRSAGHDVDTITIYMDPSRSAALAPDLIATNPRRVIFNPGAESQELEKVLAEKGVQVEKACTLVMLATGQF